LSIPGGATSDIFNRAPISEPLRTGLKTNNPIPGGPALNVFSSDEKPDFTSNRRDPNWSNPESEVESVKVTPFAGKSNESHINFANADEGAVEFHPGKKCDPTSNQSHFSIGGRDDSLPDPFQQVHRRDPNETSKPPSMMQRPSSRYFMVDKVFFQFLVEKAALLLAMKCPYQQRLKNETLTREVFSLKFVLRVGIKNN
jgi:hypothetical protein